MHPLVDQLTQDEIILYGLVAQCGTSAAEAIFDTINHRQDCRQANCRRNILPDDIHNIMPAGFSPNTPLRWNPELHGHMRTMVLQGSQLGELARTILEMNLLSDREASTA
jgi:hypothetical protein